LTFRHFTRGLAFGAYEPSHGSYLPTEGVKILSNTFENTQLGVAFAGTVVGWEVSGNAFHDVAAGIFFSAFWPGMTGPSGLLIHDNDVTSDHVAITLQVSGGDPSVLGGVEIRGNRLSAYSEGVRVLAGDPLIVENTIETHGTGIRLSGQDSGEPYSVHDAVIRENQISALQPAFWGSRGIHLEEGSRNAFLQNTVNGFRDGISLHDCGEGTVVGNQIETHDCRSAGILLDHCSDADITDNIITKTGKHAHGVRLENGSDDNTITRNTIHGSGTFGSYGVLVYGSDRNLVADNALTETALGGGCEDPYSFVICSAYRADDNTGVFLVDADDNTVTGKEADIRSGNPEWANGVRLGMSRNYCEGESNNVVADNGLTAAVGVNLWDTPTNTGIFDNLLTGRGLGAGIEFRPASGNQVSANTITGFDRALSFLWGSSGNLIQHNNAYGNSVAVLNQGSGGVDVTENYWGTPCPPPELFAEATGSIEWFPHLTQFYPPAVLAKDLNGDGHADVCSRCPETGAEGVPAETLLPDHLADLNADGLFEINLGSAALPDIETSAYSLVDTYGCTCSQILSWKPGAEATGETRFGCTLETMTTWIQQIGWAKPRSK
jgi:parallel beta-helix repeat protein